MKNMSTSISVMDENPQSKENHFTVKTVGEEESVKLLEHNVEDEIKDFPLDFVDVATIGTDVSPKNDEDFDPLAVSIKTEFKVEIKEEAEIQTEIHIEDNDYDECQSGQDSFDYTLCILCKKINKFSNNTCRKMSQIICDICHEVFGREYKSKWMNSMYNRLKSCSICIKMFYNSLDFIEHDCTNKICIRCKNCKIIFDKKIDIAEHVVKCNDVWTDSNIELSYLKSKKKLKLKGHTCIDMKKLPSCKIYRKPLTQTSYKKRHTYIHTGEKGFCCKICTKIFSHAGNLKRHTRIHTGEKPFCCNICNKTFNQASSLKNHLLIHTGEKPFCCTICKKTFNQATTLQNHTRIHTGEKPYVCSICRKSFSHATSLKNHTRIHTGEKVFCCNLCRKTFCQAGQLKNHSCIHTRKKLFCCNICRKIFTKSSNLNRHMLIHNGKKA